jgi:NitT/TauT family transport system permease protein
MGNLQKIYFGILTSIRHALASIIFGGVLLLVWNLIIFYFNVKSYVFPTPYEIVLSVIHNWNILLSAFDTTLLESVSGLSLAFIASILSAPIVGRVKIVQKTIMPYLLMVQTTPIVAIAPLFVLWFGEGIESRIASSFSVTLIPMTIAIAQAFSVEDGGRRDLYKVFGVGRMKSFYNVTLPLAVPGIISSLKFGVALAVVGAIVGELVTADAGLGYVIIQASYELNTPLLFAAIFLAAIIGLMFYIVVALVSDLIHLDRYYISER